MLQLVREQECSKNSCFYGHYCDSCHDNRLAYKGLEVAPAKENHPRSVKPPFSMLSPSPEPMTTRVKLELFDPQALL